MVTLCKDCYPCCDFCIYAKHMVSFVNGKEIKIGVDGCKKHEDEHHQSMARSLGYCKDFHCYKVNNDKEER